jgi:hypothetical protein
MVFERSFMEDQLRGIITRIENSKLSEDDKAQLYELLSEGLQSLVQPVLVKYMDKNQLENLASDPGKVTVESYAKLMESALLDGKALTEIDQMMNQLLTRVDTVLKGASI